MTNKPENQLRPKFLPPKFKPYYPIIQLALILACGSIGCQSFNHQPASCPTELLNQNPIKIICYGDSITASGWPAILGQKLNQPTPNRYQVINRGQSGDTSVGAYYRMRDQILPELPAIMLIEFGINDSNSPFWGNILRVSPAEYRQKMTAICQTIQQRGGYPIFIINHPIVLPDLSKVGGDERRRQKVRAYWTEPGNGQSPIINLQNYNNIVRDIAKKCNAPTIDLPAIMARDQIDLPDLLADDGVHLTDQGKEIYASLVYRRLNAILSQQ